MGGARCQNRIFENKGILYQEQFYVKSNDIDEKGRRCRCGVLELKWRGLSTFPELKDRRVVTKPAKNKIRKKLCTHVENLWKCNFFDLQGKIMKCAQKTDKATCEIVHMTSIHDTIYTSRL